MVSLAGLWAAHARDADGRTALVDVAGSAVVEHPFVGPLVAEFLDQCGNELRDCFIRVDRRLGIKLLDELDDRRGILNASALRRNHEGMIGILAYFSYSAWLAALRKIH